MDAIFEVLANFACFTEFIINILPKKYIIKSLQKGLSAAFVDSCN